MTDTLPKPSHFWAPSDTGDLFIRRLGDRHDGFPVQPINGISADEDFVHVTVLGIDRPEHLDRWVFKTDLKFWVPRTAHEWAWVRYRQHLARWHADRTN